MILLKCPTCAADISLDETRQYGFCSYCGTRIQLGSQVKVSHSYTDKLNADLESVRNLLNNSYWSDAIDKVTAIIKEYPDNVEALLYCAYAKSMRAFFYLYDYNSKEAIKSLMLNRFEGVPETQKAKRLMGMQVKPLYFELKKKYEDTVICTFSMLESDTNQFIQDVENNIFLLDGYYQPVYDEPDIGFFIHDGKLMFDNSHSYYVVNSVINGTISMTFDCYDSFVYKYNEKKHQFMQIWLVRKQENLIVSSWGTFSNKDTKSMAAGYDRIKKSRTSLFKCPLCGGPINLLGCKNHCDPI